MWTDVKLAFRNLRAAPGYAIAGILTLALVIAANTAIFGAVYAILLKPLPIRDPANVVIAWESSRWMPVMEMSHRQITGWSREARSFEHLAGISSSLWPMVLEGVGDPARLASSAVTGEFFEMLGARPLLGRTLTAADDERSTGGAVVLSHRVWVQRFGSDAGVIGRTLRLDRQQYIVVGVMPRGFDFPRGTEVWTPVVPRLLASAAVWKTDALANVRALHAVGRLRPGVSVDVARDELNAVRQHFGDAGHRPESVTVTPLLDHTLGPLREGLWWLLAAVGLLLLVACANLSGLTLTRAAIRRREHGIRLALGATRVHLGRLWIAETLVLGAAGGLLGLIAARWLLTAVVALAPDDVPRIEDVGINAPVAAFTLIVTLTAAFLSAGAAVLHSASARVGEVLNETARGTSGPSSRRVRSTLVIAQIALAVVLLVSAGLVVRSFSTLQRLDIGFEPANVLTFAVEPSSDDRPMRQWYNTLLERIDALPGVEASATIYLRPLAYGAIGHDVTMLYEGQGGTLEKAIADGARNPHLSFQMATPSYFRTMRIPLLRGRLFDERDHAGAPRVVVIGETAAKRLWPGQDPIGKRLSTPQHDGTRWLPIWQTVVGVVKDVHYRGVNDVRLDLYEPAAQSFARPGFIVIRTTGDPLALAAAAQAQVRALDRNAVVGSIATMDGILERALAPWRLSSWMLAVFAAIAFLLAIVGLVGLMGLEVAQRLREFAVRIALGAESHHVRAHVFRAAMARGAAGLALGIVGALAATQSMRTLLFGVTPVDAATYVGVSFTVAATVVAVSLVPAIRAARIDPIEILKRE